MRPPALRRRQNEPATGPRYRRIRMAGSVIPPMSSDASPTGTRRRRVGRLPVVLVAGVTGMAILGAGIARTAVLGVNPPNPSFAPVVAAGASASIAARSPTSTSAPNASPSTAPGSSSLTGSPPPSPDLRPSPSASPASTDLAALAPRLQATLDRVRAKLGIPGISVTILLPRGETWAGSSGLADVARKTPVGPDTAFAYASISKTFTSALILQLVGEGRLHLGDSAARLLPPLRFRLDPRITIAMLLDHTSGLADYFLNAKIDRPLQARPTATWTADDALAYVGKRVAPPGKAWHYANTNYLLLGLIAERVTGEVLGDAVRTRLLEPTGLDGTWSQVDEPAGPTLAHGYRLNGTKPTARPIDLADGSGIAPFRSVVTAAGGAGAMAGTSGDLARWARALYSGRVLGPIGTALLLSDFNKTRSYLPGVTYGYGVQALSIDGHPSLGHSGRLLGFRGAVRHLPLDGVTIAVLTNQSRADPAVVVRSLLKVVLPAPAACPTCPLPG